MVDFSALVERAGGPAAINRTLGISITDVERWVKADPIPLQYHLPLWKIAVVHGVDWTPPGCDAFVLKSKVIEALKHPASHVTTVASQRLPRSRRA